jgi:hypothetical protein
MRVRTGRFDGLRLRGQSGYPELIEVADGEGSVNGQSGVVPPASGVAGDLRRLIMREPARAQLPIDHPSPTPVLQMQRP